MVEASWASLSDEYTDLDNSIDTSRGAEYTVRVGVRVRPLLLKENQLCCRECVGVKYEDNQVVVGKTCFTFDHVFGTEATQDRVYEETAQPLIEGLGAGLNATLLAYGQTSAGKTFTLGSTLNTAVPEDQQGVIPRFVNALFRDIIYARRGEADITVRASFVELHNEDINDLLDPNIVDKTRNVSIREDPNQGVVVLGMKEVEVRKPSELLRCLEKGSVFRTTASTQMNEHSSRSHAIFTVVVEQNIRSTGDTLVAKVRFADLAGSERAKKTGTVGERFREGVNINQGLLALGNVISALGDPKLHRSHVPYRDSKLTRMLQDTLGGNSRTVMIACVSPADVHFSETLNTLKYANRAKNIKNKVVVNMQNKNSEIVKLKEKIQELQTELTKTRQLNRIPIVEVPGEDEESLSADLLTLRVSYERLEGENNRLRLEIEAAEKNLQQAEKGVSHYRTKYEQAIADLSSQCKQATAGADDGRNNQPVSKEDDLRLGDPQSGGSGVRAAPEVAGDELQSSDDAAGEEDEALAHAEEDKREEESFRSSQREMETVVKELDEVIQEKEQLMGQITRQSKVFQSMRTRYELQLQELKVEVEHVTTEKEQMLMEIQQLQAAAEKAKEIPTQDLQARKAAEEASKRKVQLEGRLAEVNRQLLGLKRRQVEAQRLIRLKDQQETQIQRMKNDILRLKGQKQVVMSRLKYDEQQHRLWRKRWIGRLREETNKRSELQKQNKRQGQMLQRKTDEAERSARKVEELRREQQQHLNTSRRKMQVDREMVRAAKLRDANHRLQRELQEREKKVRQMEDMFAELERLKALGAEGQVQEVEEHLETLDAQIDFDSECIAQSQTDILRLASPRGDRNGAQAEGAELRSAEPGAQPDAALSAEASGAPGVDEEIVAKLTTLEEARETCLACFQSISDLREEKSRLQAHVAELEADVSNRCAQIDELQARERFAEKEWAEQANAMQRLHIDKEVYLLSRVDRSLAEEHGICAPGNAEEADGVPVAGLDLLSESPTVSQLQTVEVSLTEAKGEPSSYKHHQALFQMLRCRTEQLELMEQQAEHLQKHAEKSEKEVIEAQAAIAQAESEAQKAAARAAAAEDRAAKIEQHLALVEAPIEALPDTVLKPTRSNEAMETDGDAAEDYIGESEALRSFIASSSQNGKLTVLEGIAGRTSELLRGVWRDLGVDSEAQRRQLESIAKATLRVCSRELQSHERARANLQQEHDDLKAIAESCGAAVSSVAARRGESASQGTVPLHEKHAALQASLQQELEKRVGRLRGDLQDLFGLTPADCSAPAASAQLTLLAGTGLSTSLPGRGAEAASLVDPQDLAILGVGDEGARHWVQQPANETFAKLAERQAQVNTLLSETGAQLQKVSKDLDDHFTVLGLLTQREEFFASRGSGIPALAASQRELLRLQHRARLSVAEGRVKMAEQWMVTATCGTEQEAVLQRLRQCAAQDALAELQAIKEETTRLGTKIELRKDILTKFDGCGALDQQIRDFEKDASNSNRLRGSSTKLLQEEKQRSGFRKKKERLVEDLVQRLAEWEQLYGEPFLHNGVPIRDMLQQDLDGNKEASTASLRTSQQSIRPSSPASASQQGIRASSPAMASQQSVRPSSPATASRQSVRASSPATASQPSIRASSPATTSRQQMRRASSPNGTGNSATAPSQTMQSLTAPLSARGPREQLATRPSLSGVAQVRNTSMEQKRRGTATGASMRFSPVSRDQMPEVRQPTSDPRLRSNSSLS